MKGLGVPLAIGVYPGAPMVDSEEELKRKVEEELAPGLLRGPDRRSAARSRTPTAEPAPGEVVFSGTLRRGAGALPPASSGPTACRSCRRRASAWTPFCASPTASPRKCCARCRRKGREASILSIAVNGVMAGCRPEYMPVLIAILEAMCDPKYRIEDSGSTPGWEPVVIVSGPIVKAARFQLRPGHDARRPPGEHQHRPLRAPVPAQHLRLPHPARRRRQGQHRPELSRRDGGGRGQRARDRLADLRRGPRLRGGRERGHGAQRGGDHLAHVQRRRPRRSITSSSGPT